MFYVSKRIEVAGSHQLELDYESPCQNLHGHNWIITVHCKSASLDTNGMVIDFTKIKKVVHGKMDHKNLNDEFSFNPTAENIAQWVAYQVDQVCRYEVTCYKVEVQESEGNIAIFER